MNVVIRADASSSIGIGHVMRCLALAQGLKCHHAHISLISRDISDALSSVASKIVDAVFSLRSGIQSGNLGQDDADECVNILNDMMPVDLLIVDHYGIDHQWETVLRPYVKQILVIDDLANRRHEADILLDPNYPDDAVSRYHGKLPSHCRILAGTRYVLLRDGFKQHALTSQDAKREGLLIQFGGSDPLDVTAFVLNALRRFLSAGIPCHVIVGSAYQHLYLLQKMLKEPDFHSVRLHVAVEHIETLMVRARMAVAGGGTSVWERCCVGLPSLVIANAENQALPLQRLAETGAIRFLGRFEDVSAAALQESVAIAWESEGLLSALENVGRRLVDGDGVARVSQILTTSHDVFANEQDIT